MTVKEFVKSGLVAVQSLEKETPGKWGLALEDETGGHDCECHSENLFHCDRGYKENCKIKVLKGK